MVAVDFVNIAVIVSGILVLLAVVMTLVLWQEEGRRAASLGKAQARHTALGEADPEDAELERLTAYRPAGRYRQMSTPVGAGSTETSSSGH